MAKRAAPDVSLRRSAGGALSGLLWRYGRLSPTGPRHPVVVARPPRTSDVGIHHAQ